MAGTGPRGFKSTEFAAQARPLIGLSWSLWNAKLKWHFANSLGYVFKEALALLARVATTGCGHAKTRLVVVV